MGCPMNDFAFSHYFVEKLKIAYGLSNLLRNFLFRVTTSLNHEFTRPCGRMEVISNDSDNIHVHIRFVLKFTFETAEVINVKRLFYEKTKLRMPSGHGFCYVHSNNGSTAGT
jgi:hypothetical protein